MMVLVTAKMKIKRALCVATIAMLFFIIIADSHLSHANRPQKRFIRKSVARNAMARAARNLRNLMQTRGKVFLITNQQYGMVQQYPCSALLWLVCVLFCVSVCVTICGSVCLSVVLSNSFRRCFCLFVVVISFLQCNFRAKVGSLMQATYSTIRLHFNASFQRK